MVKGQGGRIEGKKMKALMIYEMGREIRGVEGGTGEGNLNDLNKA